jgi:hypothetical protein
MKEFHRQEPTGIAVDRDNRVQPRLGNQFRKASGTDRKANLQHRKIGGLDVRNLISARSRSPHERMAAGPPSFNSHPQRRMRPTPIRSCAKRYCHRPTAHRVCDAATHAQGPRAAPRPRRLGPQQTPRLLSQGMQPPSSSQESQSHPALRQTNQDRRAPLVSHRFL